MKTTHFGTLYIVSTPIGNLNDMTPRAVETLKMVDYIAAEDTRHSAPLLKQYFIGTPLIALHEHNERESAEKFLSYLEQGKSVALISDAGTPLINDPGYHLVFQARHKGIKVVPIPGACALIAALSASGLPTHRFTFEGFLPAKDKSRVEQLKTLSEESRTMIFYEAPHRVLACLQDMLNVFGADRLAVLARELTKMYETIHTDSLASLVEWVAADANQQRGEIVILVAGKEKAVTEEDDTSTTELLKILLSELPLKQAVDLAAKISGQRKNDLYKRALGLTGSG